MLAAALGLTLAVVCYCVPTACAATRIEVRPQRAYLVNGHAEVQAKLFGLTAYEGATIPAEPERRDVLQRAGITCLGFPGVIGWCAPDEEPADGAAGIRAWYESEEAVHMIRDLLLQGDRYMYGQILPGCRELGVEPMIYLLGGPAWAMGPENIPQAPELYADLVVAYVGLLRRFDPELRLFHLDNEPNSRYYKAGKGGRDYAELFATVAKALHESFPDTRLGGPVLCWPPAWPPQQEGQPNWYTWDQWSLPLLEIAGDQLDFFDFHIYDFTLDQALEEITLLANELRLRYGREVPILITEAGLALRGEGEWRTPALHFQKRTLPWERYLLALLEHPDKVESLQMHDLSAVVGEAWFRFMNWEEPEEQTPTFWLYRIMRDLRGTRIEVEAPERSPLHVFAARNGERAACLVFNDSDASAEVETRFAGAPPDGQVSWERIYLGEGAARAADATFVHDEGGGGASRTGWQPVLPPHGTVAFTTDVGDMPPPVVSSERVELYGDSVMNEIDEPGQSVAVTVQVPGGRTEVLEGALSAQAHIGLLGSDAGDRLRMSLGGEDYALPAGTYFAVVPLRELPSAGANELVFTLDDRPEEHRLRVSCATLVIERRHG